MTEPDFIERDYKAIKERMMTRANVRIAENATEEELPDLLLKEADPEFVLLQQIAYEMYVLRCNIQDACKQNLLDFARYPMLDYLGALRGCERNEGESDDEYRERIRHCMEKFAVCGTRDGYKELVQAVRDAGEIVDVNLYAPLREISGVKYPAGEVDVYVLTKDFWDQAYYDGLNTSVSEEALTKNKIWQLLTDVESALKPDDKRPLCEKIEVGLPVRKEVKLYVNITIENTANAVEVMTAVAEALNGSEETTGFFGKVKKTISRDLTRSQVIGVVQAVPGVYSVTELKEMVDDIQQDFAGTEAEYFEFIDATAVVGFGGYTNERESN